jgi:Asp-tRNA(Asn)/Glu-tRNA(Gln) amidotransferase A subunit family amidase
MFTHSLIDDLQTGALSLPDHLSKMQVRYEEIEPQIHAFLPETDRFARLHADANQLMNRFPDPANRPALFGTLAGIKDIFHADGFSTQAGSRLPAIALQGKEAESVTRLRNAGALIFGKSVTTEFAYFFPGPTRNPHNLEHTPGGSSSGSAAAVAAGLCQIALGTQTIGSIIRPASFCGVVGVKPTYDRISRKGVIPLSPSLDHVGFFAPDVETAIHTAPVLYKDWSEPIQALKKPRLGIPEGPYLEHLSHESKAHFEKICSLLEGTGYEVEHIYVMSDFAEIRTRHDVILAAEAAQVHVAWFEKYEKLYSTKFNELIQRGRQITREQLRIARMEQDTFRSEMRRVFRDQKIDLWICPSTLGAAPRGLESTGDPLQNLPWTQVGLPTINIPAGRDQDHLPLGLQVVANWYEDESLFSWAKELEKALSGL